MKVLVCGSRSFTDRKKIHARLSVFPSDTLIINGGAIGADSLADTIARDLKMNTLIIRPMWDKYGKSAGIIRNNQMLDMGPDLVIAFYDGVSRGTAYTINEARRRNIPVEVIR